MGAKAISILNFPLKWGENSETKISQDWWEHRFSFFSNLQLQFFKSPLYYVPSLFIVKRALLWEKRTVSFLQLIPKLIQLYVWLEGFKPLSLNYTWISEINFCDLKKLFVKFIWNWIFKISFSYEMALNLILIGFKITVIYI